MELHYHFLFTLILSIPILVLYHDVLLFLAIMFAGWLIDCDHEIDYYVLTGGPALNSFEMGNELT